MPRVAAITLLALASLAAPAQAEPAWVKFATWMRTAPTTQAHIIGELDSGVQVDRVSCGGGWCQIESDRAVGYVPAKLLAAAPRGQAVPASTGCFPAQHFTMEGPIALQVCPAEPSPR